MHPAKLMVTYGGHWKPARLQAAMPFFVLRQSLAVPPKVVTHAPFLLTL